jgi:uncharacterized membrane protein
METQAGPGPVAHLAGLEGRVSRLLLVGTYAAMALIAAGTVLLLASGRSPLDVAPGLDPGRLVADLLALHPAGLLWIGLLVVVVTPAARVALSLAGFVQAGEREMSIVALLILLVVLAGIIVGTSAA